jgi:acyl dehydratase
MRMMVAERHREADAARGRGEPVAAMGPALGLRDLKWLKPVYMGDTVDYRSEVIETRASESRPNLGLLTIRTTGVNQHGEPVLSFLSITFVERRPGKT